uniref:Uncharacterized protein n=1 Tax=Magnetococcus massalia (strain MO-1) TaxID=451514 RepID=A0A1S7LGE7_MAGMO|nr:Protein of unknown function [Candidatus Magnetococcus massalia]
MTQFNLSETLKGTIEIEGWQHKTYQYCYALFVMSKPIPWQYTRIRIRGEQSGHEQVFYLQAVNNAWYIKLDASLDPNNYLLLQTIRHDPSPIGGDVPSPGTHQDQPCRPYFSWIDGEPAVATKLS